MSLFIASLNSGSNGNCYYVGNEQEAVLVDAGLSCRETEKRMKRLDLPMERVKALFISHEHGDHVKGVEGLCNKYNLPLYITDKTYKNARLHMIGRFRRHFNAYEPAIIGNLSVMAFPKAHDAADPHSFVVSGNGVNIGVFTDIGIACSHVADNFGECHAIFLESNYDEEMLHNGRYPIHLKRRISGGEGHLSNRQALELFCAYRKPHMSHVFLSHLSAENNNPQVALDMFRSQAGATEIVLASRQQETAVYHITAEHVSPHIPAGVYKAALVQAVQTSLF